MLQSGIKGQLLSKIQTRKRRQLCKTKVFSQGSQEAMLGRQYKWDLILNVHMRTKRWHRSITKSLMVFSMQVIFNHKSGIIVIQTWLSFRPILKTFKILLTTSYRTNIKPSTPTTANSRSKMTSLTTIIIRADSDQCIWVFLKIQTPLKTLHSTR